MQQMSLALLNRRSSNRWARITRWVMVIVVFVVAGTMWANPALVLSGMARLWVVSDNLDPADAIVVLGGGLDLRPFAAAELYKGGLSRQVLVSNANTDQVREEVRELLPNHVDLNRELLVQNGVPPTAITVFGDHVRSTYEESRAVLDWAKSDGARSVIIPTDVFSARRVRWIFNHELGPAGIRVIVQAVAPQRYGVDDWWRNEQGLIHFQNEVIKFIYYRLKY
jgi:uncharacterized SAM-binding protein YcdF (DUF218 family)